ncbi:SURF1 family protein [Hyphomicrobium sp.]|uniref:SURF1 family protein n=1 Tax=Hyphomicrobium sp. TaxID=82 RepID=UPI002D775F36|nr:SURF1 family protein [Hyphomicrobium sp.]HET6388913.1 SURF1 family protein [Hyphomicrobium sp.]
MNDQKADEGRARRPRSAFSLIVLAFIGFAGIAGFLSLGIWQIERRAWKLDLIERVDQRVHADPVAAPGPSGWPSINAKTDEYRRVTAAGQFRNDRETLVTAVTKDGGGYWVLTPLETKDGFTVLVNRGFVPPDKRDPAQRAAGQIAGEATVTGLLRLSEPKGAFLRSNDPANGRWFSRDVPEIAEARGLDNVAPYFIDADATPNPGGLPIGGLTVIAFQNNHLVYALTWFTLALMVGVAAVRVAREEIRVRRAASTSPPPERE